MKKKIASSKMTFVKQLIKDYNPRRGKTCPAKLTSIHYYNAHVAIDRVGIEPTKKVKNKNQEIVNP